MKCPHCFKEIDGAATKCPHCTGNIAHKSIYTSRTEQIYGAVGIGVIGFVCLLKFTQLGVGLAFLGALICAAIAAFMTTPTKA